MSNQGKYYGSMRPDQKTPLRVRTKIHVVTARALGVGADRDSLSWIPRSLCSVEVLPHETQAAEDLQDDALMDLRGNFVVLWIPRWLVRKNGLEETPENPEAQA